jgi:alkylhydroperoxidase family enzyme
MPAGEGRAEPRAHRLGAHAMARLPYPDLDQAPDSVREALAAMPPLNIFRMLAHAETAFRPFLRFGGAILGDLALDAKLRELAILQVAVQAGAEYEWVQHAAIGRAVGLSDEQIDAVRREHIDSTAFSDSERAVLLFASEVIEHPRVSNEAFAAVSERLSPREIVELLLTVGNYLMLARVMTTLDLELDEAAGGEALGALRPQSEG